MIQKQYATVSDANTFKNQKALVITISNQEELATALNIHKERSSIRGLKFPSSLLETHTLNQKTTLKHTAANYFEIRLMAIEHLQLIKEQCYSKNTFTQITIPFNLFSTNILKDLQLSCNRLIIDLKENQDLTKKQLNHLFAELITRRFYPFTKNANPQLVAPQFRVEYFHKNIDPNNINHQDAKEFLEQRKEGDLL